MTKEELEKEAEEYADTKVKDRKGYNARWELVRNAYIAGAEPREKRIEHLSKEVDDLENMKATLESKIAELEAQIEKMKCCGNCKYWQFQNDAEYYTCMKDGKRNGMYYRSCEFNLEKWELGR